MMQHDINDMLARVCCKVFENLAFMFGDSLEKDDAVSESETFIRAMMTFDGEKKGSIEIVVPGEIGDELAVNILGLDDPDEIGEDTSDDALKEVLNTTCGQLLTALFTDKPVFHLSVPVTSALDNNQWQELIADEQFIALEIDDKPVLLRVLIT